MSTTPPPSGGPSPPRRFDWTHLLTMIVTAIVAVGVTITLTPGEPTPSNPKPKLKVTVTLGGPKATVPGEPTQRKITLDRTGQKIVAAQKAEDAAGNSVQSESDLHEKQLPTTAEQKKAEAITPPGQPDIPAHVPLAAASEPGCTTAFVRNFSERKLGAPVLFGFIHWTGSPITLGPQGGLSIVRWFDLAAAQASSDYVTDQAGRCWYTVPETKKAWTQAGANTWSVSVEIINPGVLPLFRAAVAERRVVKLMIGWHHRWHIPYRLGIIRQGKNNTCVPVRSGFMAHRDAGACGGGHPDVGVPSVVPRLIAEARAQDQPRKPLTKPQKHACDVLNFHRRRAHKIGHWSRTRRAHANAWAKQIPAGRCASKYRKH
jgi:hypothetical protein